MKPANRVVTFMLVVLVSSCASLASRPAGSPTLDQWGSLISTTDSLANAGRFAAADSTLGAFERAYPGTRAAAEVLFWRALYKLDPRSSAATRGEGRALMDAYLASPTTSWYRGQANVLIHLARSIAVAEQVATDPSIVPGDTSARGIAARDQVIRDQRAEIARLNAELERIKRRLAAPTP